MNKNIFHQFLFIVILGIFTLYYAFPWYEIGIDVPLASKEYKLGLDLQGGVELDYKVDLSQVQQEDGYNTAKEESILEGLKSIIDRRVESLNINDSVITTANYGGEKHIIVQIPLKGEDTEADTLNIQRAKAAIGRVMRIEFKERRGIPTEADYLEREQISHDLLRSAQESLYGFSVTQNQYKDSFENIYIGSMSGSYLELESLFSLPSEDIKLGFFSEVLEGTYTISGQQGLLGSSGDITLEGFWVIDITDIKDEVIYFDYAFVDKQPSEWMAAKDSLGRILDDKYFVTSSVQVNEVGEPLVELIFNTEGAKIFGELTTRLINQQIAIFVGGDLLTAPVVNDRILTGKAVITGQSTAKEAKKLSDDINTGVVPAPIYLTSERTIDSKLGANSLTQLLDAGKWGFLIIVVFLVLIYRVGGLLSGIALFMYLTIILSMVKMLGIVMTLAGIAGIILSLGMAIDANILIFERMHEELRRGKDLKHAILEGFDRSWSAIWDSNLTGIITAVILWIFGVNMIKGFGLMLGIGLVFSLFSAMFITKLFIVMLSQNKNINLRLFVGFKDKEAKE